MDTKANQHITTQLPSSLESVSANMSINMTSNESLKLNTNTDKLISNTASSSTVLSSPQINISSIPIANYGSSAPVSMSMSQKSSAPVLSPELLTAASMLRFSMINSPENMDGDKNTSYSVRNLYPHSPSSYPTQPPSIQENNLLFERLYINNNAEYR